MSGKISCEERFVHSVCGSKQRLSQIGRKQISCFFHKANNEAIYLDIFKQVQSEKQSHNSDKLSCPFTGSQQSVSE